MKDSIKQAFYELVAVYILCDGKSASEEKETLPHYMFERNMVLPDDQWRYESECAASAIRLILARRGLDDHCTLEEKLWAEHQDPTACEKAFFNAIYTLGARVGVSDVYKFEEWLNSADNEAPHDLSWVCWLAAYPTILYWPGVMEKEHEAQSVSD